MSTDTIEVLYSNGPRLCKSWRLDGSIQPYQGARNFRREPVKIDGISDLYALIQRVEQIPTACIIRGQYRGDQQAALATAKLFEWEDRSDATRLSGRPDSGFVFRRIIYFADQPLHTVMFDIEDTQTDINPMTDPEGACHEWIRAKLPVEFHEVSFVWELSNSFGHPTKPGLRAHIWFWLSTPRTSATLKAWAKRAELPVDHSVFNPVQIHYTAAPYFEPGVRDPVPLRSGFYQSINVDDVVIEIEDAPAERAPTMHDIPARTEITKAQLQHLKSALHHPAMLKAAGEEGFAVKQVLYPLLSLGSRGEELWLQFCTAADDKSEHPDPAWPQKAWDTHINSAPPLSDFLSIYATAGKLGWQNPFKRRVADVSEFDAVPDPRDIENTPLPPKPTIIITGGQLPQIARDVQKLLFADLFTRGGQLVRITGASELDEGVIDRVSGQRVIIPAKHDDINNAAW
jgi:hypothetical protein